MEVRLKMLVILIITGLIALILFDYYGYKKKRVEFYGKQIIGSRKTQEDSLSIYQVDKELHLGILADGMGGQKYGEEASNLVVEYFLQRFLEFERLKFHDVLLRITTEANEKLYKYNKKLKERERVGTTLLSIVINNRELYWISVGDSRLYLYRDKKLTKLNKEHRYEELLLNRFYNSEISEKKYKLESLKKNQLMSFLGDEKIKEVDRNFRPFKLLKGDKLLLCTDGLYESICDDEILDSLKKNKGVKAIDKLIEEVKNKMVHNQDNTSIILVEIN